MKKLFVTILFILAIFTTALASDPTKDLCVSEYKLYTACFKLAKASRVYSCSAFAAVIVYEAVRKYGISYNTQIISEILCEMGCTHAIYLGMPQPRPFSWFASQVCGAVE